VGAPVPQSCAMRRILALALLATEADTLQTALRATTRAAWRDEGRLGQPLALFGREQEGMDGTRIFPNQGGERVIRTKRAARQKPTRAAQGDEAVPLEERRLLLGLAGIGGAAQVAIWASKGVTIMPTSTSPTRKTRGSLETSDLEGDAVTRPLYEIQLEDIVREKARYGSNADAKQIGAADAQRVLETVEVLEERRGVAFDAADRMGRWAIPWVGAWQCLCTNSDDASFLGGPPDASFVAGGKAYRRIDERQFIYGPGDGGLISEYLYATPGNTSKLLLSRTGRVANQGGNFFAWEFRSPLEVQPVEFDGSGGERLVAGEAPIPARLGRPDDQTAALRTTYLSQTMWITRDADEYGQPGARFAVWQRTDTRSVLDRRGLVADGQLKPSSDEQVRYGKLLFGETLSDYANWDESIADKNGNKRLLTN